MFRDSPSNANCPEERRRREGNPRPKLTQGFIDKRLATSEVEASGIARANAVPQVVSQHDTCVKHGCMWLHYGCTDSGLAELVASWQRLPRNVKSAIMQLVRGRG